MVALSRVLEGLVFLLLIILLCQCTVMEQVRFENTQLRIYQDTFQLSSKPQIVSRILIPKRNPGLELDFIHSEERLRRTSLMATKEHAIAAINGGFFDTEKGHSVTYFEKNDSIISGTKSTIARRKEYSYFLDGAILISKNGLVTIEPFQNDTVYSESKKERAVLVTGPILLLGGQKIGQKKIPFSEKRHPRSCFCSNDSHYMFITIDGRSMQASGMNLMELQDHLLKLGCKDAINLDGGGSTSLWHHEKGLLNTPSDQKGERPVSNALIVKREEDS